MKKDGIDIFKTPGGWCRRFPGGVVGPFQNKKDAENSYFVKKTEKKDTSFRFEKKKKEEVTSVV